MPVDDLSGKHDLIDDCLCESCLRSKASSRAAARESTPYQAAALLLTRYEEALEKIYIAAHHPDKDLSQLLELTAVEGKALHIIRVLEYGAAELKAQRTLLDKAEAVLDAIATVFGSDDVIPDIYELDKFVEGYAQAVKDTYTVLAKGIANAPAPEPKPSRSSVAHSSPKPDPVPYSQKDYVPVNIQTAFLNVYKAACDHLVHHGPCEDISVEAEDEAHECDNPNCTYCRLNEAASLSVLNGFY